jgi:hypothetical protein
MQIGASSSRKYLVVLDGGAFRVLGRLIGKVNLAQ